MAAVRLADEDDGLRVFSWLRTNGWSEEAAHSEIIRSGGLVSHGSESNAVLPQTGPGVCLRVFF